LWLQTSAKLAFSGTQRQESSQVYKIPGACRAKDLLRLPPAASLTIGHT
jgi:hypothetical protein